MDNWANSDNYERYMGRWSRVVAPRFLAWLNLPPGLRWLDVGCGTGALSEAIVQQTQPAGLSGVDPSEAFVEQARRGVQDTRASFRTGSALALPFEAGTFDAIVSGLVVNYFPEPEQGIAEMVRVCLPEGIVAAYVWDYAGGMGMTRAFWGAVTELFGPTQLDQGRRFAICQPEPLTTLFSGAGLAGVKVTGLDITTRFADFTDFWQPFLGGQGPAPSYLATLPDEQKTALRDYLRSRLPVAADGSITLTAKAWAVRGTKPLR